MLSLKDIKYIGKQNLTHTKNAIYMLGYNRVIYIDLDNELLLNRFPIAYYTVRSDYDGSVICNKYYGFTDIKSIIELIDEEDIKIDNNGTEVDIKSLNYKEIDISSKYGKGTHSISRLNKDILDKISDNWEYYSKIYSKFEMKIDEATDEINKTYTKHRLDINKELLDLTTDSDFVIEVKNRYIRFRDLGDTLKVELVDKDALKSYNIRQCGNSSGYKIKTEDKINSINELMDKYCKKYRVSFSGFYKWLLKNSMINVRYASNLVRLIIVLSEHDSDSIEDIEVLKSFEWENIKMPVELNIEQITKNILNLVKLRKAMFRQNVLTEKYETLKKYKVVGDSIFAYALGDTLEISVNLYRSRVNSKEEFTKIIKENSVNILKDIYKLLENGQIAIQGKHAPLNYYKATKYMIRGGDLIYQLQLKIRDHEVEKDYLDTLKH